MINIWLRKEILLILFHRPRIRLRLWKTGIKKLDYCRGEMVRWKRMNRAKSSVQIQEIRDRLMKP